MKISKLRNQLKSFVWYVPLSQKFTLVKNPRCTLHFMIISYYFLITRAEFVELHTGFYEDATVNLTNNDGPE